MNEKRTTRVLVLRAKNYQGFVCDHLVPRGDTLQALVRRICASSVRIIHVVRLFIAMIIIRRCVRITWKQCANTRRDATFVF